MGYEQDLTAKVYAVVCAHDGVKARDIARELGVGRKDVNHVLYGDSFAHDLCYVDEEYRWHALIRQTYPHDGLYDYCGWYGTVEELRSQGEGEWLEEMKAGCRRIGRNLNDARGLMHSFTDTRWVMLELFRHLETFEVECSDWEVCFELRIKRARYVRIYADVLVIAPGHAFSLEFKMKDEIEQTEVDQAAKYAPFLRILLGSEVDVTSALVLSRTEDLFDCFTAADGNQVVVVSPDLLVHVF